ncbi:tRNA synthetase RNA-binding protein [Endozoicomonas montiporae]|uniref:Heat shock protein 15 n=2 Tax=Endozoicomonas montiporae TaxID=1027273 RepID=A0A081N1K0_9GAMM|nr:S4 domain-containing protein [Endozoicomonas montiporae]AMO58746.1 ribosome-associated heat shock protein Hsp15 [Endozoicomonas montiporae CL-33]KEQ12323.1 tRNA synthetase RNA-binding protein [Endozoicomonas montiporae]
MSQSRNKSDHQSDSKIRLDKWLWAARFYKTRNIAKEAIDGGKVHLNGSRCKPGKEPKVGDELRLRVGWDEKTVIVRALSDKRQKAEVAQQLYEETSNSIARREASAEQRKALRGATPRPERRPDKKQRRDIMKQKADFGFDD